MSHYRLRIESRIALIYKYFKICVAVQVSKLLYVILKGYVEIYFS